MDALGVRFKVMGLAVANAAKHKPGGSLAARLKEEGVFVGEVMVAGAVKGTGWGDQATIEADTVAEQFWGATGSGRDSRPRCLKALIGRSRRKNGPVTHRSYRMDR